MSLNVTFIEAPFLPTHRHHTGGDIQLLGIGSPMGAPDQRQAVYWNRDREIFFIPLAEFVRNLANGQPRFRALRPEFEILCMMQAPQIGGGWGGRMHGL